MKFYICVVTEVGVTPETQLLGTHESQLQYLIALFLLLANLCLSNMQYF